LFIGLLAALHFVGQSWTNARVRIQSTRSAAHQAKNQQNASAPVTAECDTVAVAPCVSSKQALRAGQSINDVRAQHAKRQ
jgi:hypothetical protein